MITNGATYITATLDYTELAVPTIHVHVHA